MYVTIGWTQRMVRKHFGKEVAVWSGLALLGGSVLGFLILLIVQVGLIWILIGLAAAVVLLTLPLAVILATMNFKLE